jgi:hypothetical protein
VNIRFFILIIITLGQLSCSLAPQARMPAAQGLSLDQKFELYRGKKSTLSGPNCHNFVLYLLGLAGGFHYDSDESISTLVSSSHCRELSHGEVVSKGDLGLIFYDEETLAHSFIFKDAENSYQKASFYNIFAYEESKLAPMYKFFGIIEGYKLSSYLKVFRCRPIHEWQDFLTLTAEYQILRTKLDELEGEFTKVAFHKVSDPSILFDQLQSKLALFTKEVPDKYDQLTPLLRKLLELRLESLRLQIERWKNPDEDD